MTETETVEQSEYTTEQIAQACQDLVGRAEANARMAAQTRGKGHAWVAYPGEIPALDKLAAEQLQSEGHEVGISQGSFANTIMFPGREIILARP